jgi:hypothetical protein
MLFADDKLLIAQDYEDLEYMRTLIDEYELWGLKLNVKKSKYMAMRHIKRFTTRRWEGDNKSCKSICLFGGKNN